MCDELKELKLACTYMYCNFLEKCVDLEVLKCLTVHDIDKLIPQEEKFGLKIKFRQKLFEWRYQNVSTCVFIFCMRIT